MQRGGKNKIEYINADGCLVCVIAVDLRLLGWKGSSRGGKGGRGGLPQAQVNLQKQQSEVRGKHWWTADGSGYSHFWTTLNLHSFVQKAKAPQKSLWRCEWRLKVLQRMIKRYWNMIGDDRSLGGQTGPGGRDSVFKAEPSWELNAALDVQLDLRLGLQRPTTH